MTTLFAILFIICSMLFVLSNLRSVVNDTVETVTAYATRARQNGVLRQRLAFAGLWLMIFGVSYV